MHFNQTTQKIEYAEWCKNKHCNEKCSYNHKACQLPIQNTWQRGVPLGAPRGVPREEPREESINVKMCNQPHCKRDCGNNHYKGDYTPSLHYPGKHQWICPHKESCNLFNDPLIHGKHRCRNIHGCPMGIACNRVGCRYDHAEGHIAPPTHPPPQFGHDESSSMDDCNILFASMVLEEVPPQHPYGESSCVEDTPVGVSLESATSHNNHVPFEVRCLYHFIDNWHPGGICGREMKYFYRDQPHCKDVVSSLNLQGIEKFYPHHFAYHHHPHLDRLSIIKR